MKNNNDKSVCLHSVYNVLSCFMFSFVKSGGTSADWMAGLGGAR